MKFSFPVRKESDEVYYADAGLVGLCRDDLKMLKSIALANPRQRSRLCTHADPGDSLHEMFIVHGRNAYVRPHRHLTRREGLSVLEGSAEVVFFSDDGEITGVFQLDENHFYQRINEPVYHMLLIRSDSLVFHEATSGPFDQAGSEFAPWSPNDTEVSAVASFLHHVELALANWRGGLG